MLKHVTNILIGFTPTERLKESKEAESSNGKLIECYSMPWKHTNGVFLSSALQIITTGIRAEHCSQRKWVHSCLALGFLNRTRNMCH